MQPEKPFPPWLVGSSFRKRYLQARWLSSLIFLVMVLAALYYNFSMGEWIGAILAAAIISWVLQLRGILCGECRRPVKDLGEDGIPAFGKPPTTCDNCGAALD